MQQTRAHQRGLSLLSLLVTGVVLAYGAIIGAKVYPTVQEYRAVQRAVNQAAETDSVAAARMSFDRSARADAISALAGRDLQVVQQGGRMQVRFAYDKEILLGGPVYLLIKYQGESAPGGS